MTAWSRRFPRLVDDGLNQFEGESLAHQRLCQLLARPGPPEAIRFAFASVEIMRAGTIKRVGCGFFIELVTESHLRGDDGTWLGFESDTLICPPFCKALVLQLPTSLEAGNHSLHEVLACSFLHKARFRRDCCFWR